jgi:myxalamid-type polyketide synthase MxaB
MKICNTQITRQHFVQAQDFLRAATWAGLFPIEADEVLMAAAQNGIFPKSSLSFKFKPISPFRENEFEKRPYIIRHPSDQDLDALVQVEKNCWPQNLQASPHMISKRISKYPLGNCVFEIEGRIMGVIYTQRIHSKEEISQVTIENASDIHSDSGRTIQFLSISILPEARHFGPGDQLLEYMLQYSALKSDVDYIVAVSLCKNYRQYAYMPMEKYIKKRNAHNELIDEILRFHESHGGKITRLVRGYRPNDIDNLCNGVLVEYDIRSFKDKNQIQGKTSEQFEILYDVKPESIKTIIEDCICAVLPKKKQYDSKQSLMDMGVDSVHIISLRALLKQRIGFEPDSTFFFYYSTPESIIQFFEQTHESASNYSEGMQLNRNIYENIQDTNTPDSNLLNEIQQTDQCISNIEPASNKNEPVAIVGISCRFPGAGNIDEYWSILKEGVCTTSKVPNNRWDIHQYIDDHSNDASLISSQYGGFLSNVDLFDSSFFNIMPREANQIDPQHRILLEESWKAFENAGINPFDLKGSQTGIFVGIYTHDYENLRKKHHNTKDLDIYYATGNSNSIAAGRLSYFYGIHGPSLSVETACSSSLVAVHQACQSLRNNECHLALAAGVNLILSPEYNIVFSRSGMLANDGLCKTFDARANGYVRSEGCGIVVLKTLSKAIADHDNILAVIKGSAINQDGASNGITAPNGFAQEQVIRQALNNAGIRAEDVSYVEAHGTGTLLGDPVEIEAIHSTYGKNRPDNFPLMIGSVKTNIGHTESAAGIAGLIKVVLAMKHHYIPKHLHFTTLNPLIKIDNASIQIPTKGMEWKNKNDHLMAGISSFGFSGTNGHLILENYHNNNQAKRNADNAPNVLVLSSKTPKAFSQYIRRFAKYLDASTASLRDICFTAAVGRAPLEYRMAINGNSKQELKASLDQIVQENKEFDHKQESGPLAFLFTGQGAQYPGMGNFLYQRYPVFKDSMENCNEILKDYLDVQLLDVIYANNQNHTKLLNHTAYTQPALFAIEYALTQLLRSWGIKPQILMGHSVGEYVAACIAGVFTLENGLKLIAERARLMQALPKNGKMAVVFARYQFVDNVIEPYKENVSIAAINGTENIVISGEKKAIELLCQNLSKKNIKSVYLDVSHAFHSPLLDPMLNDFRKVVSEVPFSLPQLDIVSNTTGQIETKRLTDTQYWVNHARQPVQFYKSIQFLHQHHCRLFVESGPHPVLTGMGRRCLPKNAGTWLPCLLKGENHPKRLFELAGTLFTKGHDINWKAIYPQPHCKKIVLPTTPFDRQRYWLEFDRQSNPVQAYQASTHQDDIHPLLGKRIYAVAIDQNDYIFQAEISHDYPDFLSHHIVFGSVLMPAAGFIETAFAAGNHLFESETIALNDFIVQRPMLIEPDNPYLIQSMIHKKQDDQHLFKFFSLLADDQKSQWIEHASCKIEAHKHNSLSYHENLDTLRSRFTIETSVQNHYALFQQIHIDFGSLFKGLKKLWIRDNESLGKVQLPSESNHHYVFYPTLIDSCIQVAWNLMPFSRSLEDYPETSWLPVSIDRFEISRQPDNTLWVFARIHEVNHDSKDISFDFLIFDQHSNIIGKIDRLIVKQVSRENLFKKDMQDINSLRYHIQWQPEKHHEKTSTGPGKNWLIFSDDNNIGNDLCLLLEEKGHHCIEIYPGRNFKQLDFTRYQINPLENNDYENLFDNAFSDLPLYGIVFLWGIGFHDLKDLSHTSHESKICASIAYLIQSLDARALTPKIWCVTCDTQAVKNNYPIQLSGSSIWGLCRIIGREHQNLMTRLIDIDHSQKNQHTALQLFNEIIHPDQERQIAFRKNMRYVSRLKKANHTKKKTDAYRLITSEPGTLDNLTLASISRPEIKPDEVEISVQAAGLNYKDVLKSLGMLEQIPLESSDTDLLFGLECAGIIESVGSNVSNVNVGDKVIALHAPGCFGSFVTVKADRMILKPDHLSFVESATLPIVFLTAWYSLIKLAKIKKGDRVLIHGAAGGVGQAAIQIIKFKQAKAYVTASEKKFDYLHSLGVEKVMNSRTFDFADDIKNDPGEVDIVLNSLNGDYIPKSMDLLSTGGTFVEIGKIGIWTHEQVNAHKPDILYHFFDLEEVVQERPEFVRLMFKEILQEFAKGTLTPIPCKTFPVSEITHAFRYMARSKHVGKIAIDFSDNESQSTNQKISWPKSTCLITGGFGDLGLETARWLIQKGCQNIALCGRSKPSAEASQKIKKMAEDGVNIIQFFGDIADQDHVKHIMDSINQTLPSLKGIFHAAGINDDAVISRQNLDSFQRVMHPKIDGSWHLHMASKDYPLDFFVCFSSFVSIMGWPGQSNYAAANAFMDALVHHRKQLGLPATTINWGPWASIGMAARLGKHLRDKFDANGIKSLNGDHALSAMDTILNQGISQSLVVDVDWQKYHADTPFFESFIDQKKSEKVVKKENDISIITRLNNALPGEAKKILISYIRAKLAAILGINHPEQIHLRKRLFDAGMDSLMAIELKNTLESDLGHSFRNSLLFDYPTVEALVEYINDQVIFPKTQEINEEKDISFDDDIDSLLSEIDQMSDTDIENQLVSMN